MLTQVLLLGLFCNLIIDRIPHIFSSNTISGCQSVHCSGSVILLRLYWCDPGWWRYKLNTNGWSQKNKAQGIQTIESYLQLKWIQNQFSQKNIWFTDSISWVCFASVNVLPSRINDMEVLQHKYQRENNYSAKKNWEKMKLIFIKMIQFSSKIDKTILGPNFFDPKLTRPKLFQTDETWHDQRPKIKDKDKKRQRPWQTQDMACELVWNCWHFRQLRTWIHENYCNLTIKSDTEQHLQFLRCFLHEG